MKSLVLVLLPALALAQCDAQLPSGKECGKEDEFDEADPDACSWYFRCKEGCVTHEQCQAGEDGLPKLFHELYEFCTFNEDVDCGSRPCVDPTACSTQPPKTTTVSTKDCGHLANCTEMGNGYHPDPWNCRKYWECVGPIGTHHMCEDDDNGIPMVFDLAYYGCNYQEYTICSDRPICDECDENCHGGHTTPEECGHLMDCKGKPDGFYPDKWNCRKYWQCSGGAGTHFMCKDDQQYNYVKNWCDYDDNVECGARPICDECDNDCHDDGADCGPDDHHPPTICKGRENGWMPDAFNCAKYWHCEQEVGEHFMCPKGQVYKKEKNWCDHPENVDCGSRPTCDHCDENCHW